MSLKEKYQEYQQRQEAIRYFRSNNDAFLSPTKSILMALSCFMVSSGASFVADILFQMIHIRFSFVYVIIGYLVAMTIRKFTTTPRLSTTLTGIVAYILGISLGNMVLLALMINQISILFSLNLIVLMIQNLINLGLVQTIMVLLGAYTIYYLTN